MQSRLTCRELVEFLAEYLEGRLPESEHARFEHHLAACHSCRCYLRSYEATVLRTRDAFAGPSAELPGDVPEDLVRAILAARDP
jgi:anti-sigma factor RsiW